MKTLYARLGLVAVLLVGGIPSGVFAFGTPGAVSALYFRSGGKKIRADLYSPSPAQDKHRSVVVLYGAGGVIFDGPQMRRVARQLAGQGYSAYLIHYFNRTGTIVSGDRTMQKNFDLWLVTVRDATNWVRFRQKPGKSRGIGIYGYSLGAFLSIAVGSDNKNVDAIVEQAGGIWNDQARRVGTLPPVLLIHGQNDQRVPLQKYCLVLQQVLRARGTKFEKRIFPDQSHRFSGKAMIEVRSEMVRFFDRHLAGGKTG